MPYQPARPCRKSSCKYLTDDKSGYCPLHLKEVRRQYDDRRPSSSERGYDRRWQKARTHYLQEHPLCVECEKQGKVVSATTVDHIQPYREGQVSFYDRSNWQSLCDYHHKAKSMKEIVNSK